MAQLDLIGVPLDLGGGRRGVDMGPSAVRIAGIADRLAALGHSVCDRGDIVTPTPETRAAGDPKKRYVDEIRAVCDALYAEAIDSLGRGALPIVIGGDHSLGAGSVAATALHARRAGRSIGLLWIDAHADMNTPATTVSGNVHGMPLAALLGEDPRELALIGGEEPKVRPEHTVLVGIRNLDEREKEEVRASGVHVFTMKDIDRRGAAAVMEDAIALASSGTAGIHVSFDLDVCDPAIAPGVGTPVRGGLNYREAHMVMEMLADTRALLGLDLVEVNPVLDVQNMTAVLAAELAASAMGMRIL
ncbi:MAG TPA: arginase [Luteitalea sp.]|nr:arginase [Luteitalea sp.]